MALALAATGYFIYLVEPWTPNAVVASVIIYNAAFGYRYDQIYLYRKTAVLYIWYSWGPLPWLYPPEVRYVFGKYIICGKLIFCTDNASHLPSKRSIIVHSHKLGIQLGGRTNNSLLARLD